MLRPSAQGASLIVCSTCRFSTDEREDASGVRGGARLASALRDAAETHGGLADLAIEEMPCLFNCAEHCSIHLRAPGKIGYVLGRFQPTTEAAGAILDYAVAYMESTEGVVPYRQWPEGVKGHFIVRLPPAGQIVRD